MTPHRPKTYVLRLWFEADKTLVEGGKWRFWLEEPHTQKRWGFTSLEQLSHFLDQAMGQNETPFDEGDKHYES
jgi:hypothetical protein